MLPLQSTDADLPVLKSALLSLLVATALSACVLHHQRILGAAYRVFKAHKALVAAAEDIQARQKDGVTRDGHAEATKQQPVRYERIFREIWELVDLKLVLPATLLSASVAYLHLLDPKRSGQVWDVVAQPGATLELVWPVVQAKVVFSLVGYVLTTISSAIFSHARWNMNEKVRQKLVKVVLTRDMELYDRAKAGELMERIRSDPSLMDDVVNHSIERSVRALIQLVGGLVMIFSHDLYLGLGGLVLHFLTSAWVGRRASRGSSSYHTVIRETMKSGMAGLSEAVSNIQTVQGFVAEDFEAERFQESMYRFNLIQRYTLALNTLFNFAATVLAKLSENVFVVLGAWRVVSGVATVGEVIAFQGHFRTFSSGLNDLLKMYMRITHLRTEAIPYFQLIDSVAYNREGASPRRRDDLTVALFAGDIIFNSVHFSYPSRIDSRVLHDLTLTIPPGKVVALCGPSGAGKSTVVKLLQRFYCPTKGVITLSGVELCDIDVDWYRNQLAYVPQEPILFDRTIAENIAYGMYVKDLPQAEQVSISAALDDFPDWNNPPHRDHPAVPMASIIAAAQLANAHDFISELPNGYLTKAGKAGSLLSGGQKQRIAIARAVIRNPRMIVMDEPTSHLDPVSEQKVQHALDTAFAGYTQLIVAHRMATIQRADITYFVDEGRVVEAGTHAELMAKRDGRYRSFVESQIIAGK